MGAAECLPQAGPVVDVATNVTVMARRRGIYDWSHELAFSHRSN